MIPAEWAGWVSRLVAAPEWSTGTADPHRSPSGADWVRRLPGVLDQLLDEWSLVPDGPACTGWTAIVVPVRRGTDRLALKVGWPHPEARAEHLALRRWNGDGAVRLVAAAPSVHGLLLERLDPGTDLTGTPIDEACGVIGGLLRRLHVAALPQAPALADFVVHELRLLRSRPDVLPRRYLEQVTALVGDLLGDPASGATLLHADLHFRNVLAGEREPWLAIDPKPMSGHPGFELHPVLRNRVDELRAAPRMRQAIRRRFEILCESAGLDEDAARDWTVVHAAFNARWDAGEPGQRADEGVHIAVIKALTG